MSLLNSIPHYFRQKLPLLSGVLRNYIFLDISEFSAKIIDASFINGFIKVHEFREVLINEKNKSNYISFLLKNIKGRNIFVTISDRNNFFNRSNALVQEEMLQSENIEWQLQNYFPRPIDELIYDYQKVENSVNSYIFSSCDKKIVDIMNYDIEKTGNFFHYIQINEVSIFNIAQKVLGNSISECIILDCGHFQTNAIFVKDNQILSAIKLHICASEIDALIQQRLNLTNNEIRDLKEIQNKLVPRPEDLSNILHESAKVYAKELLDKKIFISDQFKEFNPKKCIIFGGGFIPGLNNAISSICHLKVLRPSLAKLYQNDTDLGIPRGKLDSLLGLAYGVYS